MSLIVSKYLVGTVDSSLLSGTLHSSRLSSMAGISQTSFLHSSKSPTVRWVLGFSLYKLGTWDLENWHDFPRIVNDKARFNPSPRCILQDLSVQEVIWRFHKALATSFLKQGLSSRRSYCPECTVAPLREKDWTRQEVKSLLLECPLMV